MSLIDNMCSKYELVLFKWHDDLKKKSWETSYDLKCNVSDIDIGKALLKFKKLISHWCNIDYGSSTPTSVTLCAHKQGSEKIKYHKICQAREK